eukprot:tig00000157_g9638.t1
MEKRIMAGGGGSGNKRPKKAADVTVGPSSSRSIDSGSPESVRSDSGDSGQSPTVLSSAGPEPSFDVALALRTCAQGTIKAFARFELKDFNGNRLVNRYTFFEPIDLAPSGGKPARLEGPEKKAIKRAYRVEATVPPEWKEAWLGILSHDGKLAPNGVSRAYFNNQQYRPGQPPSVELDEAQKQPADLAPPVAEIANGRATFDVCFRAGGQYSLIVVGSCGGNAPGSRVGPRVKLVQGDPHKLLKDQLQASRKLQEAPPPPQEQEREPQQQQQAQQARAQQLHLSEVPASSSGLGDPELPSDLFFELGLPASTGDSQSGFQTHAGQCPDSSAGQPLLLDPNFDIAGIGDPPQQSDSRQDPGPTAMALFGVTRLGEQAAAHTTE